MKDIRRITIEGVANGIEVKIGCKTFVYEQENLSRFITDLKSYLNDPQKTTKVLEQRWDIKLEEPEAAPDPEVATFEGLSENPVVRNEY